MIFADTPTTWQDLETRVEQILRECGCQVERSKHVGLPRGGVDLDVYARDGTREPALIIICECKNWNSKIPKNVVHAFRTVVQEAGAHVGIIISARGFQIGAREAARNTNIDLLTWGEFQARFYDRWFDSMRLALAPLADEVFRYSDYFHKRTTEVLNGVPSRVAELQTLWKRFSAYTSLTSYSVVLGGRGRILPPSIIDPRSAEIREIAIPDARTCFDLLLSAGPDAIAAYESFIAKYGKEGG